MFLFILGILLFVASIIVVIAMNQISNKLFGIVGLIGSIVAICGSIICSIPAGHIGIVTTFGKIEETTLKSGIHMVAPWNTIIKMDNRVQKFQKDLSCFSSDLQEVSCKYTLNYQVNSETAQDLYKNVGANYLEVAIDPVLSETVKTIIAKYNAEEIITNRALLAEEIENLLKIELEKYNIDVNSTAIEDLDFTDSFTNAVEAKQVAAQNKLKAEIEQAQAIKQAEADAEVAKTKAEAEANIAKIQAEADLEVQKINADAAEYAGLKESAKNKAINESLTGDLLKYFFIQQWNGIYPEYYVGSDNVSTILGMPTD